MQSLFSWTARHGLRALAAFALAALTLSLAAFNVQGWLAEDLALLATLALCFEVIGFVFAVLTEDAARAGRFDRALVCFVILAGSAGFNTVGGHRAWEASMRPRQEAAARASQAALDASRAALLAELAEVNARIPAAPQGRGGPQTAGADRETWLAATAEDRARRGQLQGRLDGLAIVAAPAPAFDERLVWGFLAFLEIAKALGLWAIGLSARAQNVSGANKASAPAASPSGRGWDASEAARRLVAMRRDRQPAFG